METIDIKVAYQALKNAEKDLANSVEEEILDKRAFESAKFSAIRDGMIVGKNEAEREARAAELLAGHIETLRASEDKRRTYQFYRDMAALDVECLRLQVRLLEATKAA